MGAMGAMGAMGHYNMPILTDQQPHLHCGLLAHTLLQKHLIDSGIAELVFDHCVPVKNLMSLDVPEGMLEVFR